jgi:hypothetical protein
MSLSMVLATLMVPRFCAILGSRMNLSQYITYKLRPESAVLDFDSMVKMFLPWDGSGHTGGLGCEN